jgi:hypothetical protein
MSWKSLGRTVAFALAFVVNPVFFTGCARLFGPSEQEAVSLVEAATKGGPYRFTKDGRELEVSFDVRQSVGEDRSSRLASPVRSASACGSRTFLRSASACLDTTTVPVEGTMTVAVVGGATLFDHVSVTGNLEISGRSIDDARLTLNGPEAVWLRRQADGKFTVGGMARDPRR